MFANTHMGGIDLGFPDVCLTPVGPLMLPIPYPNFALGVTGILQVPNVLIAGAPANNFGTIVPQTMGDSLGVGGGIESGTFMGPSIHLTCAESVLIGGQPATRLSSTTLQNLFNCHGVRLVPSQFSVVILAP